MCRILAAIRESSSYITHCKLDQFSRWIGFGYLLKRKLQLHTHLQTSFSSMWRVSAVCLIRSLLGLPEHLTNSVSRLASWKPSYRRRGLLTPRDPCPRLDLYMLDWTSFSLLFVHRAMLALILAVGFQLACPCSS